MQSTNLFDQLELDLLNCPDDNSDDDEFDSSLILGLSKNGNDHSVHLLSNDLDKQADDNNDIDMEWRLLLSGTQKVMNLTITTATNDDVLPLPLELPSVVEIPPIEIPADQQVQNSDWTTLIMNPALEQDMVDMNRYSEEDIKHEVNSLMDSLIESIEYLLALSSVSMLHTFTSTGTDIHIVEDALNSKILEETMQIKVIQNDEDESIMLSQVGQTYEVDPLELAVNHSSIPTLEEAKTYKLQLQNKDNQDEANLKKDYDNTKAWMIDEIKVINQRKERRIEEMKKARQENMAVRIQRVLFGWLCRKRTKMLLEQRKAHLAKKALHEAELACSMKESLLLFEEDKLSTLLRIHIALIETEQTRLKKEDNDSAPLRDIPIFRQTKVSDIPSPILDQCSIKMENNNLQHGKMEGINSAVDLLVYEASCPFDQDPNGQLKQGLPYHSVNKEETQNGKVIPNPHGCQRMEIDRLSIAVTIPHSQTSQSSEEEVEYFDSCEYSSCSSLDDDQAFEDEAVEFGFSERSIKWDDHKSNDQLSNTTCLIIDQHAWKFERREHAKNSDVEKPWTWVFQLPEIEINMKKNVIWMVPSTISFDLSCPIVSKSGMMKMKELLQKCLFSKLWKSLKVAIDFNRASDVYRYLPNHKEQDIKSLDLSVENLKDIAFISEYRDINHLTLNVNKVTSLATLASNPSIEFLSVADNAVENCKGLESLPNLRYLNLDSNRLVEMQYMDSHKLMILSVTCNQLKAMPSFRASNLLKLDLFANQIESIESIHLKRFPNLVHLNLGKNKIQSIAVDAFAENKTLQTLILSHNKLSRLPRLSLPNLISLWCNGNQLESLDSWVSHSATSSSAIPAPPVSSFLFLPLLQKLYLQDNQISTIHPTSLSGLPLLKELDLSFNRLETVSSLDGLWVARNLACLKLNDNPIFKTFQESKFLSIKILVHFPKLSSDSMGMSTGSNSEHIMFDQMKAVYEARCEESKFFARVEQRSLLHHHGKKKFHGHRQQNHHLGSLASASVDQKIKRQMEIFQLEQDINVLRNKKLFLKRPNSLEKCDLIQTEARNHRFAFDTMRKMSQSLPTLVSSSSSAAVNHQLVSFQFTTNDQDFDKIRDLKLTSSITVAKSNADRRSHHNHNSHAENDKRKNVRIQLPVINYDQHAIAIQKVVRGFLLRCRFRRIQGKLHYQDDELDELFALEGMDMSAFDLNPDELLDDRYPGKQHTGGEYLKQGVADVPSSAFIHEEELSQPVTFVYGDHRKRKFSARKNGDSADDGNQAAGHIFVEELSRPGSSHSAVTINSAKTSARSSSDIDSMVSDDNSKKTPLKQNQAALIEEWGISDPKLMATFLKRNKKIQNHIKASAAKEQNAEARYQKFVKQSQTSRAVPPHAPHGKPRPSGRQVPPAWLSMDKQS